jgi:hypothetical protein
MSVRVHCPKCGHVLESGEHLAGALVQCPECGQRFKVKAAAPAPTASPGSPQQPPAPETAQGRIPVAEEVASPPQNRRPRRWLRQEGRLTVQRKIILACGAILIVLVGIYPPWTVTTRNVRTGVVVTSHSYHDWLWGSPPTDVFSSTRYSGGDEKELFGTSVSLAIAPLVATWIVIAVAAGALAMVAPNLPGHGWQADI